MGYKRTKYNICQPFMKKNNCDITTKMLEKKIEKIFSVVPKNVKTRIPTYVFGPI